jgi:hypothetical protein
VNAISRMSVLIAASMNPVSASARVYISKSRFE